MKVLIADKFEPSGLAGLAELGCEVVYEPAVDDLAQLVATVAPEVLVVRSRKTPAPVLGAGKGLRLVIRAGAGVDNIDVAAATQRQIAVCNCPGMNAVAVAELVMGLLICCDRRIPDQTAESRAGRWNKKEFVRARGLKGLRLAVVGVGSIGQEVVKRAVAFGMHVVVWSRSITPQHASALNCEFGGTDTPALLALARRSDAVTVHLPAAPSTDKLFAREFFEALRPGAYFINTSRGSLVDEGALREAVLQKGVRCGLDVHADQPAEAEAPWQNTLVRLTGVYSTHHVGASTDQAQTAVAQEVVRIVKVFLETGQAQNCVVPLAEPT